MITREDLARVIGEIDQGRIIVGLKPSQHAQQAPRSADVGDAPRRSPGLLHRHYAPRASLMLVDREKIGRSIEDEERAGRSVGAILIAAGIPSTETRRVIELGGDPTAYAASLYAALHHLDDDVDVIVVERPPDRPEWQAVLDRLARGEHR